MDLYQLETRFEGPSRSSFKIPDYRPDAFLSKCGGYVFVFNKRNGTWRYRFPATIGDPYFSRPVPGLGAACFTPA
jgi:hypothetical protein